jgi:hypothetical protein
VSTEITDPDALSGDPAGRVYFADLFNHSDAPPSCAAPTFFLSARPEIAPGRGTVTVPHRHSGPLNRPRRLWPLLVIASAPLVTAYVQTLPALPGGSFTWAVQVDTIGNIYLAGVFQSEPQNPSAPVHTFVAKLSPDGSRTLWRTPLASSNSDSPLALTIGADHSVYVVGRTASPDFPPHRNRSSQRVRERFPKHS